MTEYVITDPCYILDKVVWNGILKDLDTFAYELEDCLTEFVNEQSFVCETGYGDWCNALISDDDTVISDFTADSGMVSVCRYTNKVAEQLEKIQKDCYCIFEAESPLKVEFNTNNKNWTVVNITDATGKQWTTIEI